MIEAVAIDTGEVFEIGLPGTILPGTVSSVGLLLPDALTFNEWVSVGDRLKSVEHSIMWWLGDWLRYGERRYKDTYKEAMDTTDYSYSTLAHAKWVAEQFPEFCRRRQNLSWSHHQEAAELTPEHRDGFLDDCEHNKWSRARARTEANQRKNAIESMPDYQTCTTTDLNALIKLGLRFGTVYGDPPWVYDNQGTRAATSNHYEGMSVDELCQLPIGDLMLPDGHLHLWTTNGFLFDCPRIFDAWGFEFRSSFMWIKPQIGIGNYWRNSHEFLLTAIRGDAKSFRDHSLKSWLECDRGPHSEKPEQVRSFIERASPGPYLEIFGRRPVNGWVVWGNQIERGLFDAAVQEIT